MDVASESEAPGTQVRPRAEGPRPATALRWAVLVTLIGVVEAAAMWLALDYETAHIFIHQFVLFELPGGLTLLAVLLGTNALARRVELAGVERVIRAFATHPWWLAAAAAGALAVGALVIYHDHPVSMDEYLPWFQARVFAAGRLTAELPPPLLPWLVPGGFVGQFFDVSLASGRVVPIHWPGLALLMTPFTWLHAPWLTNPVIAGVGLLLLGYVARRTLGDEDSAGWACWLALASPAFVVNALSYYSMNAHLVANLAYTALLLEITPRRLAAAGAVGSLALVLNQPLPHFLFAIPWIVWLAWRPGRVRNLACLAAGYLPLSGLLGFGWLHLRSVVRGEGVAGADTDAAGSVLEQTVRIIGTVLHPPTLELMSVRLLGYVKVWNWAAPALPLLAVLGYLACRGRPFLRVVAASAVLTVVGYWFTPPNNTQGHGWGFRYFHSAWWVLPLFAAALAARWHPRREQWARVLAIAAITGLLMLVPLHLVQVERFIARHLAQDFPVLAQRPPGAVEIHLLRPARGYYVRDLVQNDPFLREPVLRLVSRGPKADREMLRALFPGARLVREDRIGQVWLAPAPL